MKSLAPILLALQLIAPLAASPPPCCVQFEAVDTCCDETDGAEPACPVTPSGECALDAGPVQATTASPTLQAPAPAFALVWTVAPSAIASACVDRSIVAGSRARAAPDESLSLPLRN